MPRHEVEAFLHQTEDRELTADEVLAERRKDQGAVRARCDCGLITPPCSWQFAKWQVKEHRLRTK